MTDVLKGELGFKGIIVSDWNGIDELPGEALAQIAQSVNAGIDMMMVPDKYKQFIEGLKKNVADGRGGGNGSGGASAGGAPPVHDTVHGHGSVALADGSVRGGHWFEAHVSIIAEAFVTEEEPPADAPK